MAGPEVRHVHRWMVGSASAFFQSRGGTMTDLPELPNYAAGTWHVLNVRSYVGLTIKHMMVSKVRGWFTSFTAVNRRLMALVTLLQNILFCTHEPRSRVLPEGVSYRVGSGSAAGFSGFRCCRRRRC